MKFSLKAAAVAVASLGAGGAYALPLSEYDSTVVNVYYGGATATDNVLENLFLAQTGGICVAGTIDIYRAPNQRVVFCRVNSDRVPGFPSGTGAKVAFHKESEGGSSNGVIPLIDVAFGRASSLRWLDLAALRDGASGASCTSSPVAPTTTLNGYTNHNCTLVRTPADTASSSLYDPNGGISDVEPALSFPAPSPTETARLVSVSGLGIVFGVPVTTALYRALQVAQFSAASGCRGSDSPSCVPSLTRPQIRALYSGQIIDWSSFTDSSGTRLTEVAGVTAPTTTDVFVCRRVSPSGTQSSYETYWLLQRCQAGVNTFVLPDDGSTINDTTWVPANPANGFVNAGPSSGNVRSCLEIMNNANRWAIGVLSTEVPSGQLTGFRMVRVDGAPPTLDAVANGDYDFFTENTLNRIRPGFPGAVTGLRATLLDRIAQQIGLPAIIRQLNEPFAGRPWGNGGVLSIPRGSIVPNPSPATPAAMATNPVNTQSRQVGGLTNNCTPPVMVFPSPAT